VQSSKKFNKYATTSDLWQLSSKASKFSWIFQVLHNFLKFLFSIVTTFHIFECFEILQEEKKSLYKVVWHNFWFVGNFALSLSLYNLQEKLLPLIPGTNSATEKKTHSDMESNWIIITSLSTKTALRSQNGFGSKENANI